MRKKLLFVIPNLSAGGGEKSLVNLLSQMDFNTYQVDLFLLDHQGLFMELLPKEVCILPLPGDYRIFTKPLFRALLLLLLRGNLPLAYNRFMYSIMYRYGKHVSIREQYNWKYLQKALLKIEETYDAAIGFLEKTSTYFCVDKVNAGQKIGWIHIDYDQLGMDPNYDRGYFEQLTHIVTVSEQCASILKNRFPNLTHKVSVIRNIVSPKVIKRMAAQTNSGVYGREDGDTVILSIGRLHDQKNFDLAIEACELLLRRGHRLKWYVIGEGEERVRLTELIQDKGLENHFVLLGLRTNPYPYIKQADLYVQTSKFEGKSIAIDEAKILHKPIVVTNYSTAKDQITDGENGLIVEMNTSAVADGIERLMKEPELVKRMRRNLSEEKLGTEEEILKLYALLGGEPFEEASVVCHEQSQLRRRGESVDLFA